MYNFSLTKRSQQSKTARHYKTPMKSSIGSYVWLFLTRFPANRDSLLKLYIYRISRVSKPFCNMSC